LKKPEIFFTALRRRRPSCLTLSISATPGRTLAEKAEKVKNFFPPLPVHRKKDASLTAAPSLPVKKVPEKSGGAGSGSLCPSAVQGDMCNEAAKLNRAAVMALCAN